jgi:hypothetical protein
MYRDPHDTQWVLVEYHGKKVSSKNGMLAKSKDYYYLKCPISGRV